MEDAVGAELRPSHAFQRQAWFNSGCDYLWSAFVGELLGGGEEEEGRKLGFGFLRHLSERGGVISWMESMGIESSERWVMKPELQTVANSFDYQYHHTGGVVTYL
jgi:hypothetical protein